MRLDHQSVGKTLQTASAFRKTRSNEPLPLELGDPGRCCAVEPETLGIPITSSSFDRSLARLRRLEHFRTPKWLRLLRPTPKGRHYSGIGGTGPAAILGGG